MKTIYNTKHALSKGIIAVNDYDPDNKVLLEGAEWHKDYESAKRRAIEIHLAKIQQLKRRIKELKQKKAPTVTSSKKVRKRLESLPIHKTTWGMLIKKKCPEKYQEIIAAIQQPRMKVIIHELNTTYSLTTTTLPGIVIYSHPQKENILALCTAMRWKILKEVRT